MLTPIREYEQAVYIYWLGRELPTVKIGHTNNPGRRLSEFTRETGTPGHKAGFAAVVWLDRRREAIELAVHRRLAAMRRNGEWFAVTPEQALDAILTEVGAAGIRYEVEDFAGLLPETLRRREEVAAAEYAERSRQIEAGRAAQAEATRRAAQAEREAAARQREAAARQREAGLVRQREAGLVRVACLARKKRENIIESWRLLGFLLTLFCTPVLAAFFIH